MVMTYFWAGAVLMGTFFALLRDTGPEVTSAALDGARRGVELTVAMAGPLCLWSGLGNLMQALGLTDSLARLLSPVLGRLYPSSRSDPELAGALSANVTANLLGLGNAATPMGIRAAGRLRDPKDHARASDELCRLVVMNTASIQLLPTTVAVVRRAAGAAAPFDILPCVWVSSIFSVCAGLSAAWLFGRAGHG